MRMLSSLQQSLIPAALPELDGIELSAAFRPAERDAQVGGDFYDAFTPRRRQQRAGDRGRLRQGTRSGGADRARPVHDSRGGDGRIRPARRSSRRLNDALIEQVTDGRFCTVAIARVSRSERWPGARIGLCRPPTAADHRCGLARERSACPARCSAWSRIPTCRSRATTLHAG